MDNAAVIVVAQFISIASMFNGDGCAGPIPILVSANPEEALDWIGTSPKHMRTGERSYN